ncbi:MAG: phosphoenolpyruvate--protein phosphotransferase [Chitinivibrionia bacterium]|nr:phosphoenolpyruvate--protein phosphotransferase [Chitinivibrionia bacterium]
MQNKPKIYEGTCIVRGKGYGKAVIVDSQAEAISMVKILPENIATEIERFEKSRMQAKKYYEDYSKSMLSKSKEYAEISIVEMYKYILNDPILTKQVLENISKELMTAETAVRLVAKNTIETFQAMEDEYFRDRDKDVQEVADRMLFYLSSSGGEEPKTFACDVVLFLKRSLMLSDIIGNDIEKIKAIVCASSGKTSHAVIVARSNSIPVISDINFSNAEIEDGCEVLVDSDMGIFTINPSKAALDTYYAYVHEKNLRKHGMPNFLKYPVFTGDGMPVLVMSNVSIESDAFLAAESGADGIGLVRTEILFTESMEFPTESDQIKFYESIFNKIGKDKSVCIRVMDIGGDKMAKFLPVPEEKNPFMGWRAVRIYRDKSDILETQLRAIFKAGQGKKYGIMFPMITTSSEWDYLREFTLKTAKEMGIQCPELGVLFEVPLAILEITTFLETLSFASIGTNDLIQYLSAADRSNSRVNYLYNPIEPAFLKIIKTAIEECNTKGKPISMCGDMAARPECTVLLLGLGLTRFSVSPPMIPIIKEIVSSVSLMKLKEETNHMLLNMKSTEEVANWLDYMNSKYCKHIFEKYRFVPRTREL